MCSEDSKDINTTNNCHKWDCKLADKNKRDKNYNWLYRDYRERPLSLQCWETLNEENEQKSTLLGKWFQIPMTHWLKMTYECLYD